jgi:TRAP-type C4-dicarboxylate transport system substrate-binding protein
MKRLMLKTLAAAVALAAFGVAHAQDKTIKFATQNPKGHPLVMGMEKFAEMVAAKSGGKIKVNLFPGGVLGGDAANVSALQGGTLEMVSMNSGILASQVKDFEVYDFPFMFASTKEADAVVDGPFGKKMHAKLEEKGLVGLAYWELGFPQNHQQQACHQQGGRPGRPEAARDPQRDQRGLGQGTGRQPDAAGLPRGVRRTGAEGHRRPGKPADRDQCQQVL